MLGMVEELRVFKGDRFVLVSIHVQYVEQHAQIPVVKSEAQKEERCIGIGQNAANLVGYGRVTLDDLDQKLDQVSLGKNQRTRILVVAKKVIDEGLVLGG